MTPSHRYRRSGKALIAVALLAACSDGTGPAPQLTQRLAESRWESNKPASYSFVLVRYCECTSEVIQPVRVMVVQGNVVSRRYTATGADVAAQYAGDFPSVDGLFELINRLRTQDVDELRVEYNRKYGYPTIIAVDRMRAALDDEVLVTIREFQVD